MDDMIDDDMPPDSAFEDAELDVGESPDDKQRRMDQVQAFSAVIKEKRADAINARRQSGIERIWQEDEDYYEGCDQYNQRYGLTKGRTTTDGLTATVKPVRGRSTAFANITRPYCDAAAARVADMLLPTDDRNWAIRPTPIPALVAAKEDRTPIAGPDGQPVMQAAPQAGAQQSPGMLSRIGGAVRGMFGGQPAPEQQQQMQPVTVADMAAQAIDKAKKAAEAAQQQIDDWLIECKYHAEVRKVIESSARIGVGILKGPYPRKKKSRAVTMVGGQWAMEMEIKTSPTSVAVDPWNFYPDGNCGEDISKGSYVFERGDITARGLKELKGTGYIDEMIDLCIQEGPISSVDNTRKLDEEHKPNDKDLYEIWYFQGIVSKKDMQAAGCECDVDEAPCVVTMVNDRVIKIAMSPLDSGEFTYDVMVWQNKIGHWAGIGIARQMRTCQGGLNGAVRALMDNAGISAGPQIIVDRTKIDPADGKWEITPRKIWWSKPSDDGSFDAQKAFAIVSIETRQPELLAIIQWWTGEAEQVTGLPMLMQGQQGQTNPTDKVGIATLMNNNSSTVLRRIARTFDDRITEPHIGRYYEWLLLHGPDEAKGDFQIDARGSSALVERDIQNQAMMQLLGMALNPAYTLDPEKVMKEVLKGMRLDPKSFIYDDEKKQAMANQPPPEDPRVTAAKIMAGSKTEALQADAAQADQDRQLQVLMAEFTQQLASADGEREREIAFASLKEKIFSTTSRLNVQRELSDKGQASDLYKHNNPVVAPPTEPQGRAATGRSFEQ